MAAKISKEEVNYKFAGRKADERCGTCVMFQVRFGSCTLVAGIIRALDTCDRWEPKEEVENG